MRFEVVIVRLGGVEGRFQARGGKFGSMFISLVRRKCESV